METLAAVAVGFLSAVLICIIMTLPVMLCWNALIPELFGLASLGFWDALVLSILCSVLFKRLGK